jgi:DNA-binding transcriptional LysR family regulator
MKITFKDLENYVTCAQSKTLTEAAEKLGMAQPSLSLGLKKLETELGYKLFLRSSEGMKLSPHGRQLLPEAQLALEQLEKIKGKKSIIKFKIGCHPSVGMFILGNFLRLMHKERPDLDFEIINASSSDINKLVIRGEIDFGLIMNPADSQGLIVKTIGEDDVHIWESSSRYQNKLIYNSNMHQALSIISRWKQVLPNRIEVENLELIAQLTNSGAGMGILPSQVVKSQRLSLNVIPNSPSFKDRLCLVCYPEILRLNEGKLVFDVLKRSFSRWIEK